MTTIDWVIIGVLVVSALISVFRGFMKEALSLLTWIFALIVARLFSASLAALLSGWLDAEAHRYVVAFIILFVATLIVGTLINYLVNRFIVMTGLKGLDRLLGTVFGLLRGLIIVVVALSVGQLFALDQFWQDSALVPYIEPVIGWAGDNIYKASGAILSIGGE